MGKARLRVWTSLYVKWKIHWRAFKYKNDKISFLASEWLMNGDGKRRSRDMDQEAISDPIQAVECGGLDKDDSFHICLH